MVAKCFIFVVFDLHLGCNRQWLWPQQPQQPRQCCRREDWREEVEWHQRTFTGVQTSDRLASTVADTRQQTSFTFVVGVADG
mmetsp:Transcript_81899/g.171339  ORF Transcript_81899/g.171339 Transcript_81899/m.171339 type:complete len:82 (-) Transcript_81899:79-324(-)